MEEKKKCPYCGEEILAVAKKCKHCGEWLNNDEEPKEEKLMIPCPVCGEMIEEDTMKCPHCNELLESKVVQEPIIEEAPKTKEDEKTRSFFDYYFVEPFVKHYFRFKGRINRKHFWISMLLWITITTALYFLNAIAPEGNSLFVSNIIFSLWFFLSIIPIGAAILRRMRDGDSDIGMWGWWFYILPLPYMIYIVASKQPIWLCAIPFIILLWWLVKPSDDNMRDDGLLPDEQPKVAFMKSDVTTLCVIFILSACLILFGHLNSEDNNSIEEVQIENQTDDVSQTIESNTPQIIKEAYLKLLSKFSQEFDGGMGLCYYFLFDITGDGIPELWIKSGTCEADYRLSVYTYDNGLITIDEGEEGYAGSSSFYEGKNYILQAFGKQGYACWIKYTFKGGKLLQERVFEENIDEEGKDIYTEPSEQYIEGFSFDNPMPIISALGD